MNFQKLTRIENYKKVSLLLEACRLLALADARTDAPRMPLACTLLGIACTGPGTVIFLRYDAPGFGQNILTQFYVYKIIQTQNFNSWMLKFARQKRAYIEKQKNHCWCTIDMRTVIGGLAPQFQNLVI